MGRSRGGLANWALQKAEEYLESAQANIEAGRLFPAAEEVFRSVENSLETFLYCRGVEKLIIKEGYFSISVIIFSMISCIDCSVFFTSAPSSLR